MDGMAATAGEAWRRYTSVGALDEYLMRPEVFRAWERSHLSGANARLMRAELLSPLDAERLLDQQGALIRAARPYMEALSRAAGGHRHAAMLGDRNAIVLAVRGDERTVTGPESVPGPGSLLAEEFAGANGIASPIAEGTYVELVGHEHFIGGFAPFTCQGIPLRDPDGSVAGCLSISVRSPEAAERLRDLLHIATAGLGAELATLRLETELAALAQAVDPGRKLRHEERLERHVHALERSDTRGAQLSQPAPLLQRAEALLARARRTAATWRAIAGADVEGCETLGRVARRVLELFDAEARERGIELRVSMDDDGRALTVANAARRIRDTIMEGLRRAGDGELLTIALTPHGLRCTAEPARARESSRGDARPL